MPRTSSSSAILRALSTVLRQAALQLGIAPRQWERTRACIRALRDAPERVVTFDPAQLELPADGGDEDQGEPVIT